MAAKDDKKTANRLIHESSPYLLQHAYNPVDWHPWGEETLEKAAKEDKPILLSIGYAACHWCHVMERESFEDEQVAALMNEHFVCIKVDREERPDVDQLYMEAVQALTGSGGWPLNVFLTPQAKPFYGGTYFPPQPMHGRPSWRQVVQSMGQTFTERRQAVEEQAERITAHLQSSDQLHIDKNALVSLSTERLFTEEGAQQIFLSLKARFDLNYGGFGNAPKFPGFFAINYLLQYHHHSAAQAALQHALLSLDRMTGGGIYDHIGGGMARYSVDERWLVPHFEKMLYDNALLVDTLSAAYKITGRPEYGEAIHQTLEFVAREMSNGKGGFYSSLDADSEGEEGRYYVWSRAEVEALLAEDAALFCEFYDISDAGNWEGKNIPHQPISYQEFAANKGKEVGDLKKQLGRSKRILLEAREKRVRPGLDDKVLLSWNAMMCSAYAKAWAATQEEQYRANAIKSIDFMLRAFRIGLDMQALQHAYKNDRAYQAAFLDDYALLIKALLDVYEICYEEGYIEQAVQLTAFVVEHFSDEEDVLFFYTEKGQKDILLRKTEVYDNVTPSGNSVMASNLQRLAVISGNEQWRARLQKMLLSTKPSLQKYGISFANWACLWLNEIYGIKEIAVVGDKYRETAAEIAAMYIPNAVLMATSDKQESIYPLLQHRASSGELKIYLCENYSCQQPVGDISSFKKLLNHRQID